VSRLFPSRVALSRANVRCVGSPEPRGFSPRERSKSRVFPESRAFAQAEALRLSSL